MPVREIREIVMLMAWVIAIVMSMILMIGAAVNVMSGRAVDREQLIAAMGWAVIAIAARPTCQG